MSNAAIQGLVACLWFIFMRSLLMTSYVVGLTMKSKMIQQGAIHEHEITQQV